MRNRVRNLAIAAFVVTAFPAALLRAAETEKERHERVERLIEQLASVNKPPKEEPGAKYSKSYDRSAQATVLEAWQALLKEGHSAFPELVGHVDDRRYCCTVSGGAADRNISVGRACLDVIDQQISVYEFESIGRWRPYYLPNSPSELQAWWRRQKGKSLRELQIETAEHALFQTEMYDASPDREPQKRENIIRLQKFLNELRVRADAIDVRELQHQMIGLPGDNTQPYFGK